MPEKGKHKQISNPSSQCPYACRVLHDFLIHNIHKQFPLDDEELGCRHGAETLVGGDEEESSHPARTTEQNPDLKSSLRKNNVTS